MLTPALIGLALALLAQAAPATRPTTFPSVAGQNLNGREIAVPGGIDTPYALVLVAFSGGMGDQERAWREAFHELEADHANVVFYDLPTVDARGEAGREELDDSMRGVAPSFAERDRLVTLYTDVAAFCEKLGIDDRGTIWVGLIDRRGKIYWKARGAADDAGLRALRKVVRETASPEAPPAR